VGCVETTAEFDGRIFQRIDDPENFLDFPAPAGYIRHPILKM